MAGKPRGFFYWFDYLVVAYCSLMVVLLALFGRPIQGYRDELAAYSIVALLAILIARHFDEERGGLHRFVRLLYPAILIPFFYRETGGTMFLFFDQFLDYQLTAFEQGVFGVNPTIYADQHLLNVITNEILSLFYFLYYPLLPAFLLILYVRREYEIVKGAVTAISLTFFVSYILFFAYPIEGPRWYFADRYLHAVEGPVFRPLVNLVIANGAVHGGCMPSTHYAVTLVIMMFVGRYYPKWLWFMVPMSTGLALGTVWGRFHYVSDVVVGALIALAATVVVWRLAPAEKMPELIPIQNKEAFPYHAS